MDVLPWTDQQDVEEGWGSGWRKENQERNISEDKNGDNDNGKSKDKGKGKGQGTGKKGSRGSRPDYMDSGAFLAWLKHWQHSIELQDSSRKVLLLVDNHGSHTVAMRHAKEFPNIRIEALPPNSTSITQPLDAGIIAVFKRRYRHLVAGRAYENSLNEDILEQFELASDVSDIEDSEGERAEDQMAKNVPKKSLRTKGRKANKVTNFEAWELVAQAWNEMKPRSIRNCFAHVPIFGPEQKKELRVGDLVDPDVYEAIMDTREDIVDRSSMDSAPRMSLDQRFPEACAPTDFETQINNQLDMSTYNPMTRDYYTRLSSLLDGSPILGKVIDQQCLKKEFSQPFEDAKAACTLQDGRLSSDDDEGDEDYINDATHGRQPGKSTHPRRLYNSSYLEDSVWSVNSSQASSTLSDSIVLTQGGVIFAPPGTVVAQSGTVVLPARTLTTKRNTYSWMTDDLRSSDISDPDLVQYDAPEAWSDEASEGEKQDAFIRAAELLQGDEFQAVRHALDVAAEKISIQKKEVASPAYVKEYNKRQREEDERQRALEEEEALLKKRFPGFEIHRLAPEE